MRVLVRSTLSALAVTLIASHAAFAKLVDTPEMNPVMGIGALAFLCGAVIVIRGRQKA